MTGHTGRLVEAIKAGNDPRRAIEPIFAFSSKTLIRFVDSQLAHVDRELYALAADPLPRIWQGYLANPGGTNERCLGYQGRSSCHRAWTSSTSRPTGAVARSPHRSQRAPAHRVDDALEVSILMAREHHPLFDRAAARWVGLLLTVPDRPLTG
jgi:hypothetical protein